MATNLTDRLFWLAVVAILVLGACALGVAVHRLPPAEAYAQCCAPRPEN